VFIDSSLDEISFPGLNLGFWWILILVWAVVHSRYFSFAAEPKP